jgi:aminoglycoside phosphotransferase (APT) family kinase protein
MSESDLDKYRTVIVSRFPELAHARFSLLGKGWHSAAVDVDGRLVFKFPQGAEAEAALLKEAGLLAVLRSTLTVPVPDLAIYPGPPLFSLHGKLEGEHLPPERYAPLPEHARQRLAQDLALFYAELHALDRNRMAAAGATPIAAWLQPRDILARGKPVLPTELHTFADQTIEAWRTLPPEPHGTVYGFFDGHGWNMAFDYARNVLSGIYDFGDSGLGPLHQDFIYANMISPDLTRRIVSAYEALTGRTLDRTRIDVLTGVHRLWELAELAHDPAHVPAMVRHVASWAAARRGGA